MFPVLFFVLCKTEGLLYFLLLLRTLRSVVKIASHTIYYHSHSNYKINKHSAGGIGAKLQNYFKK